MIQDSCVVPNNKITMSRILTCLEVIYMYIPAEIKKKVVPRFHLKRT